MTVCGIVPKNSRMGFYAEDKGMDTIVTTENNQQMNRDVWRTKYTWHVGLSVKDWRYVVRICNIDRSTIKNTASAYDNPNIIDNLIKAYYRLEDTTMGRPCIYASREVMTYLHLQYNDRVKNSSLSVQQLKDGMHTMSFMGIPIKRSDALEKDESRVV